MWDTQFPGLPVQLWKDWPLGCLDSQGRGGQAGGMNLLIYHLEYNSERLSQTRRASLCLSSGTKEAKMM